MYITRKKLNVALFTQWLAYCTFQKSFFLESLFPGQIKSSWASGAEQHENCNARYHIVFSEPGIGLLQGNGNGGRTGCPMYQYQPSGHFKTDCICLLSILMLVLWEKSYLEFQFSPKCFLTPSLPPILNGLKIADFPESLDHIPKQYNIHIDWLWLIAWTSGPAL